MDFEVELVSFDPVLHQGSMEGTTRLQLAATTKQQGNELYKKVREQPGLLCGRTTTTALAGRLELVGHAPEEAAIILAPLKSLAETGYTD